MGGAKRRDLNHGKDGLIMGVQVYLLDHRQVTLFIGALPQKIGTLRNFWKVTEIDEARAAEIKAAEAALKDRDAPPAVMMANTTELPLAAEPQRETSCHLVLGWDVDRASVTDFLWDYLPILGYAVRDAASVGYTLHEERGGLLYPLTSGHAVQLGILDQAGNFLRRGQPAIAECRAVKPYIKVYADADCVLSDGRAVEILTSIKPGILPDPAWYVGKRPADVQYYPAVG